jgi:hypothetical protein
MSSRTTRSALLAIVALFVAGLLWLSLRPPAASTQNQTSSDASQRDGGALVDPVRLPEPTRQNLAMDSDAAGDAARGEQGQVIARASWGSGPDQLGHSRPQEANPEAPMSHILGPDGTIHVLDQVNRRIQRFSRDGRLLGSTPVSLLGAQDVALGRDGSYVLMDRLADRRIAIVGQDGRERASLSITGEHIERTGNVTGVFVDGDQVLVEREHGPLVRVGDTNGRAAEPREEVPGRPTRDGRAWITAGITDAAAGRLYINAVARPSREHMFTRELRVAMNARTLVMLDSDARGTLYLGALGVARSAVSTAPIAGDAAAPEREQVLLMCIDGTTGRIKGQATLPPNTSADEAFREFAVPDEGGVIYAVRNDQGVEFRRYDCR